MNEAHQFLFGDRHVEVSGDILCFLGAMYRTHHPYGNAENAIRRLVEIGEEFKTRYGAAWEKQDMTQDDQDRLLVVCALSLLIGVSAIGPLRQVGQTV